MDREARVLGSNPVLAVRDLAASAAWYARVLDCTVTEPDPGNWAFCKTGKVSFMLGRCPDTPPATDIGDHSYVACLTVTDVDAFHRRAVAESAEILKAPTNEPAGAGGRPTAAGGAAGRGVWVVAG